MMAEQQDYKDDHDIKWLLMPQLNRLRFSMRSVLGTVAVISLLLAATKRNYDSRKAEWSENRALAAIAVLDGYVKDCCGTGSCRGWLPLQLYHSEWYNRFIGRAYCIDWSKDSWTARERRQLNGPSAIIDDDDLGPLLLVRRIHELSLAETVITDRSIPTLSRIGGLKRLEIQGTGVSDSGAARLAEALGDCEIIR